MAFDVKTAIPVDETPQGINRVSGFDIGSAKPVEAQGQTTAFEDFQEFYKTNLSSIGPADKSKSTNPDATKPVMPKAEPLGVIPKAFPGADFLNSAITLGAGDVVELATKPLGIDMEEQMKYKEQLAGEHKVADILGGTAAFFVSAPLFPVGLLGVMANFATVSGLSELGHQRVDESLMKPVADKAIDVARETSKGALMGPIWHYSGALQFIGRPFASALVRAGVRGAGTASLDKVYGADLASAFKDGGIITALSLMFESPVLAKTALGRGIIAQTNDRISVGLFGSEAAQKVAETSKPVKINPDSKPEEIKKTVLDSVNTLATQIPENKKGPRAISGEQPTWTEQNKQSMTDMEDMSSGWEAGGKLIPGTQENSRMIRSPSTFPPQLSNQGLTHRHLKTVFEAFKSGKPMTVKQIKTTNTMLDWYENRHQEFLKQPDEIKIVNQESKFSDEEGKLDVNVIPGVAEVADGLAAAHTEYIQTFKPMNASEQGKFTAEELRSNIGQMVRSQDQFEASMRAASKIFEQADQKSIIESYTRAEKGQAQLNPELQPIYDTLQKKLLDKAEEVKALGTGKLEDLIENYLPHIWEKPGEAQKFFQSRSKRPLEGSKAFMKKRIIGDFSEGIALGLKPVSWNPVDLAMIRMREMDKYIMAHKTLNALKEQGIVKFVGIGKELPPDFAKIDDRINPVHSKGDNGELILRGHWYAQKDAARIMNNYLSPGLTGKFVYDLYRGAGNTLNQFQLGMSAFHLGFTSMDATVSKFALGINKLAVKDWKGAIAEFAKSPLAPVTNFLQGRELNKAWHGDSNDPIMNIIAEKMAEAGGRAKMDRFYATKFTEQWNKSVMEGKILTASLKIPFYLVEQMSRPIMEYIVPRQKMGVFADLMKFELETNSTMTNEQMRVKAQKIWDSVDNRMGQMVYDNLFWNKVVKDMAMAGTRSLGWNLGTIREVGGGVKDIPLSIKGIAKGEGMSYRTAYIMALPIVAGVYGAIYQYIATGKIPEEPRDYWFPKNGGIDKDGNPSRVSLPTYMKDIYHYMTNPLRTIVNKQSPVNNVVADMLMNRDFYGTKIVNEDDPAVQKALDELKFVLSQFMPFSVSNIGKSTKKDLASNVQPFMGITPAPYDISMTKAERTANELSKGKIPLGARTKEQAEHSKEKKSVRNQFFSDKDITKVDEAVKSGTITKKEKKEIIKESKMTDLKRLTQHLSFEETLSIYKKGTPEEKTQIDKILRRKKLNKQRAGTWNKDEETLFKKHFKISI